MTCAEARDAMLEAEPAVLQAAGPDELGRHLASCAACAALAARILETTRGLDRALAHLTEAPAVSARRTPVRARPRGRRRLATWGLAAAAVVATITLVRLRPGPLPPAPAPRAAAPAGVEVDLASARAGAVVFHTADPTITVVWFY